MKLVPFFYACAVGCAVPGCGRSAPEPMRVHITRRHLPEQMQGLISAPEAETWLTLCQVHEAEFRKLGWLVGSVKEEETD